MAIHQDCKVLLALNKSGILRTYDWQISLEMHLPWLEVRAEIKKVPPELVHLCHPNCFPTLVDWRLQDGIWIEEQEAKGFLRSGPWHENVTLRMTYCDFEHHNYDPGMVEIYSPWGGTLIAFMEEFGIKPVWRDDRGLEAIENSYKWMKHEVKHCDNLIEWAYSRKS